MRLEHFCLISALFIPFMMLYTNNLFHKVPEGHVGIYFRGGALLKGTTEPGYHFKLPLVT